MQVSPQLVDPRSDQFIESFVVGRAPQDRDLLLRSATLLSTFRVVRVDPVNPGWLDSSQAQNDSRTTWRRSRPLVAISRGRTYMRRPNNWRGGESSNGMADLEPSSLGRSPFGLQHGSGGSGTPGNGTGCSRAASGPAWTG